MKGAAGKNAGKNVGEGGGSGATCCNRFAQDTNPFRKICVNCGYRKDEHSTATSKSKSIGEKGAAVPSPTGFELSPLEGKAEKREALNPMAGALTTGTGKSTTAPTTSGFSFGVGGAVVGVGADSRCGGGFSFANKGTAAAGGVGIGAKPGGGFGFNKAGGGGGFVAKSAGSFGVGARTFATPVRVAVTPLHVAAESGNVSRVRELLVADVDVNEVNAEGNTPLLVALEKGHLEVAQRLLAADGHGKVYIKTVELDDDGVPSRTLREVALLRQLSHVNVVRMLGVYLLCQSGEHLLFPGRLELVFESTDQNLCKYCRESAPEGLRLPMVRSFLEQILRGLTYCHSRGVMHRNLQPKCVLIDRRTGTLKITGFDLARSFQVPIRVYSHEVVCLWYRPPEILLGERHYTTAVDMWSVGVILSEMLNNAPLWPGDSEVDELFKIFKTLGSPSEASWPGVSALPDFSLRFPHWPPVSLEQPPPLRTPPPPRPSPLIPSHPLP